MKTTFLPMLILAAGLCAGPVDAATAAAPAAQAAQVDPVVLARMQDAARAGKFAVAFKRGLRASPASPLRDRVLALEDDIVADVFARILARHFDVAEATALAAFYASADGEALTNAQLAAPGAATPAIDAEQRARIETFFATDPGKRFNRLLGEKSTQDELQLALAFIAGPGK